MAKVTNFMYSVFLGCLLASVAFAETTEAGPAKNDAAQPDVQQGSMSPEAQTFKVSPELADKLKTFSDQYGNSLKEFEAEINSSMQKFSFNLLKSKNLAGEYKTTLNHCMLEDMSAEKCDPEETRQDCEQRLLAKCLEVASNRISSRYADLNSDLVQMKTLAEKWGPVFCDQMKSWNAGFNFFGPVSCQW